MELLIAIFIFMIIFFIGCLLQPKTTSTNGDAPEVDTQKTPNPIDYGLLVNYADLANHKYRSLNVYNIINKLSENCRAIIALIIYELAVENNVIQLFQKNTWKKIITLNKAHNEKLTDTAIIYIKLSEDIKKKAGFIENKLKELSKLNLEDISFYKNAPLAMEIFSLIILCSTIPDSLDDESGYSYLKRIWDQLSSTNTKLKEMALYMDDNSIMYPHVCNNNKKYTEYLKVVHNE